MYKPGSKEECLAYNIKLFCDNNEYTNRDFAALVGMSEPTVQKWLALKGMPDAKAQRALEKIFHAKFDKICSTTITVRLAMGHSMTVEDVFPYNCIIAAFNNSPCGIAVMSYFESPEDADMDLSYRNITPADFDKVFHNELNYREQAVIELRYRDGLTLDVVSKQFELTRERIRQIEHKALRKINYKLKSIIAERPTMEDLKNENVQLRQRIIELESANAGVPVVAPVSTLAPISELPIEELGLSVRTYNCLKRKEINFLGDIINYQNSFFKVRNLGKRSLDEVIDVVRKFNLGYKFDYDCQHFVKETVI